MAVASVPTTISLDKRPQQTAGVPRDLRVAYLAPSLSRSAGGIFEVERRLAQCLNAMPGVEVSVYGTRDPEFCDDAASWSPVEVHAYPYHGPQQFRWSPALHRAFRECTADVAHLHVLWMHTSIIMRDWARRNSKPFVTTLHGMLDAWALGNSAWKKRLCGWAYERDCLAAAGCVQVFSASELAAARSFGLTNPICIIPNGVDLPGPVVGDPPWPAEFVAGRKVLLYLGRLHPKKGLVNLFEAWSLLRDERRDAGSWCLVVAGWEQGGHEQNLKKQAAELGLEEHVLFAGPLFGAAKGAAFHHADAFVLPSFSEGLPMVVLEAWSYGKPVVMTPECNLPEGFAEGAAISIAPKASSIAEGLRQLMAAGEPERKQMGERGLALVKQRFTWQRVADEMHEVYQWLVGGGDPPNCVVRA